MRAAALQRRLRLTDDELLAVLDEDALTVITDDLDHRPEVPLLGNPVEDGHASCGKALSTAMKQIDRLISELDL